MTARPLIAIALESAIGAELTLFAVYLLSSPRRRSAALYLLAALALAMALLVTGNLLIGARLFWLSDIVLFFDLLTPALVFLYVANMRRDPRPLTWLAGLHAAPAIVGLAIWKAGLLPSMDLYVNACWLAYLVAAGYIFARHYPAYSPRVRQRFLTVMFVVLASIWLLRLAIVARLPSEPAFREGLPYLLILAALFATTCLLLLTALRHPDLLSVAGSHVKYGLSAAGQAELDHLNRRLLAALDKDHPYLNPDFSLADLAALLETSPRQVSQLVNARHGTNVSAYVNRYRAQFATRLLAETDRPIKAIAFESGFRSKSIFNREFQRCFAASPTEYRVRAKKSRLQP